jgi:carnitine 3-dehydrogenase
MSFVTHKTFAALGSGVIGSGWVARALAHGLDVVAWDPAPGAEAALRQRVAKAWGALERKGLAKGASQDRLRFVATIGQCVQEADFIQESAPERLDLKLDLHAKISAAAQPDVLIGSSTSGLLPSEFYAKATHPERCVVGHPFNPVYLLPLVGVGGARPRPRGCGTRWSRAGHAPLHVRKEVPGFIADRLLEAQWHKPCIWSTMGWPPPARLMTPFATAPVFAGLLWFLTTRWLGAMPVCGISWRSLAPP